MGIFGTVRPAERQGDDASPEARARAAMGRGDQWLHLVVTVARAARRGEIAAVESPAAVLQTVESLGWELVKADHVWRPTGSGGTNYSGTFDVATHGELLGVYLFRRRP